MIDPFFVRDFEFLTIRWHCSRFTLTDFEVSLDSSLLGTSASRTIDVQVKVLGPSGPSVSGAEELSETFAFFDRAMTAKSFVLHSSIEFTLIHF